MGDYLRALLADVERKNGWTVAEHAGAVSPNGCSGYCAPRTWTATASELGGWQVTPGPELSKSCRSGAAVLAGVGVLAVFVAKPEWATRIHAAFCTDRRTRGRRSRAWARAAALSDRSGTAGTVTVTATPQPTTTPATSNESITPTVTALPTEIASQSQGVQYMDAYAQWPSTTTPARSSRGRAIPRVAARPGSTRVHQPRRTRRRRMANEQPEPSPLAD